MEIKKYSTYEFKTSEGDDVIYKVNQDIKEDSFITVSKKDGSGVVLSSKLLIEIHSAMQEVNPFDFVDLA